MRHRLGLILALFSALGCRSSSSDALQAAKPFECDSDEPSAEQCNAGWLCGLDERCFDPDAGTARPCLRGGRPEESCPSDWLCGADSVCFNPHQGRAQACVRDGGPEDRCPGGWRCAIENVCFDPRAEPRARECAGDDQCSEGWRCNAVSGRCQGINQPDNFQCLSDSDCECTEGCDGGAKWRCDLGDEECRPVTDSLTSPQVTLWKGTLLSPLRDSEELPVTMTSGPPTRYTPVSGGGYLFTVTPIALAYSDHIDVMTQRIEGDVPGIDGGRPPRTSAVSLPIPGAAELEFSEHTLVIRLRDGGIRVEQLRYDEIASGRLLATELKSDAGPVTRTAAARIASCISLRGETRWAMSDGTNSVIAGSAASHIQTPVFGCNDLGFLGLLADAGAAVAPIGGALVPLDRKGLAGPNLSALFRAPRSVLDYRATLENAGLLVRHQLVTEFETLDGGTGLYYLEADETPSAAGARAELGLRFVQGKGSSGAEVVLSTLCPGNAPPDQFLGYEHTSAQSDLATFRIRCPRRELANDAGTVEAQEWRVRPTGRLFAGDVAFAPVSPKSEVFRFGVVPQPGSTGMHSHAGRGGRVWLDEPTLRPSIAFPTSDRLRPVILDRRPVGILSIAGLGTIAVSEGLTFEFDSRFGLLSLPGSGGVSPLGVVAGARSWVITEDGVVSVEVSDLNPEGDPRLILTTSRKLGGTVKGILLGRHIYLTSGDTLYGADVTTLLENAAAPAVALQPLLIPSPGLPITSFAVAPTNSGPAVALLTSSGAFSATPLSKTQWQLSPVDLSGPQFGEPISVVAAGNSLRVVMASGSLFTFPARTRLADKLEASGSATITDAVRYCGDTVAVSRDQTGHGSFYVLAARGWSAVDTISRQLRTWEGSRLQFLVSGRTLYVANDHGRVLEVTPEGAVCTTD